MAQVSVIVPEDIYVLPAELAEEMDVPQVACVGSI